VTVLADTSIWVDYLRSGTRSPTGAQLDTLLAARQLAMCGPVAAELLAGAPESSTEELWSLLRSLAWIHIGVADWHTVGAVAGRLRRAGTPVPLTDLVIAAAAVSAGAALWSHDSDFLRIATAMPELSPHSPPTT